MSLESTPASEATDTIRTLHVDDDSAFAELTAEFLELNDPRISVVSASSASDGLDRLETDDIDCVVSDYDMPGRNGIEFLEAVRAEHPDLPFILFTGKGSEEIASEAVSAGVTDYLQKERGTDQYTVLANRIVNVAEKRRTEADLERRTRQHEAVATLGRKALEADDRSALFDEAARLVADRLGNDYAAVLERRPDGELSLVAGEGWTDGSVGTATVEAGEGSPAGRALSTGEPVVVADLGSGTRVSGPALLVDHGVESGIAVVVGTDDEPWGVLGTYTTAHRRFTEHDVTFVRNVANVLGAAIDRLRTEERLRESEARFREIAELTPDGLFRADLDGTFTYVSPAAEELLGRPAEELVGMGFDRLVAEPSYLDAIEGFSSVVNGGVVRGLALTLLDADGEPFEVEVSASPVRHDGEVVLVQGIARDVTERARRERELQRSRERYRTLVEHFPNGGVFLFDEDLRFTAVGGTELTEVGLSAETVIGKTPAELFPPDDADRLESKYRAVLDGEPQSFDEEWDGRRYQVRAVPVRDADGTIVSGMSVAQNVTARRTHERNLDQLRERTHSLTYTQTPTETIELAIETAAEVIGAPLSGFHAPNDAGDVLEPMVVADAAGDVFDDLPRYRRDAEPGTRAAVVWDAFDGGESIVIDDTGAYEPLTEESPVGSAIINPVGDHGVFIVSADEPNAYDETDRSLVDILTDSLAAALDRVDREQRLREREHRLERQNERLEEFTSIVSHDLRNPLNVAQGRLALVYDECDSHQLDAIATAHGRMEALIDDLLTLAREGETGDPEPVDLATVAEASWQHVATAGGRLVIDTDRTVRADEGRLTQLLENLFRNSVEHGSTDPRSQARGDSAEHSSASNRTVSGDSVEHGSTGSQPEADDAVERGGADVTVRVGDLSGGFFVEDDGTGIPIDERDRVFDSGYSTAESGTGFGLNIVATIAAEHGWSLAVTESDGGGARFEITDVDTG
ncbi:PAS domain S-box protein [Salinigranum sp. GCM10025319]|uniref:PAS domain S-box protein n=1 Tax=Salinigranum sp. GCM10025319 TaxID=3252687 RepID=UPI0036092564